MYSDINSTDNKRYIGLIAEEVIKIIPEINLTPIDGEGKPYSIDYDRLSVLLLAELKKLKTQVATMQQKIDTL